MCSFLKQRIDVVVATFRCVVLPTTTTTSKKTYSRQEVAFKGQNATLDRATSHRILRYIYTIYS